MTCLGIDPSTYKGIVVKSSQHFYAGFEPIAEEIGYINAPDIPPDFANIAFTRYQIHSGRGARIILDASGLIKLMV